ncbi:hypothetical protein [Actinophytocola sediminis]
MITESAQGRGGPADTVGREVGAELVEVDVDDAPAAGLDGEGELGAAAPSPDASCTGRSSSAPTNPPITHANTTTARNDAPAATALRRA